MCAGCRRRKPARLCARAKGGQILTTQLVQHLAAARSAASFLPFGAFELKGLPGPTPLYEVPWPVGGGETVPVPDPLTTDRQFSFVGRQAELGALATDVDRSVRHERLRHRARDRRGRCGQVPAHVRVRAVDRSRRPHHPLRPLRRGRGLPVPADRRVAPPLPRARVARRRRHGARPPRRPALAARPRARRARTSPPTTRRPPRITAIRTRCTKPCSAGSRSSPTAGRCCSCSTTCSGRPARRWRCCSTSLPRRPASPGCSSRPAATTTSPNRNWPRCSAVSTAPAIACGACSSVASKPRMSSPWSPSRSARPRPSRCATSRVRSTRSRAATRSSSRRSRSSWSPTT